MIIEIIKREIKQAKEKEKHEQQTERICTARLGRANVFGTAEHSDHNSDAKVA